MRKPSAVRTVPHSAASQAEREDWPQFRGPNGNCLPAGTDLPTEWGENLNVKWTAKVPGRGWSSPMIWEDKVFLTTAVETDVAAEGDAGPVYRWEVYCIDLATGGELWKQVAFEGPARIPKRPVNTYASETPVTDGERVYAYFGMTGICCYTLAGELVWRKDLEALPMQNGWGTASSPALYGGTLYLQVDNEQASFLAALDAATGDERWRVPREEKTSWSSPIVWENTTRAEIVVGGNRTRSYEPASGEVLWQLDMTGGRSTGSPVAVGDVLYVSNEERGSGKPDEGGGVLFAVKAGATGNITPAEGQSTSAGAIWSRPKSGVMISSPLVYQGLVYAFDRGAGMAHCYDASTGEPVYQRVRVPDSKLFWASPWAYDGKVFALDQGGTTHVLEAGREFNVLSTNSLPEACWSTPAFSDDALIIRAAESVYCIQQ